MPKKKCVKESLLSQICCPGLIETVVVELGAAAVSLEWSDWNAWIANLESNSRFQVQVQFVILLTCCLKFLL